MNWNWINWKKSNKLGFVFFKKIYIVKLRNERGKINKSSIANLYWIYIILINFKNYSSKILFIEETITEIFIFEEIIFENFMFFVLKKKLLRKWSRRRRRKGRKESADPNIYFLGLYICLRNAHLSSNWASYGPTPPPLVP